MRTQESEEVIRLGEIREFNGKMFMAKYWLGSRGLVCVEVQQRGILGEIVETSRFARRFNLDKFAKLKLLKT